MGRSTSRGGSGDVVGRGCLHRPGVAWGILPAHPTNPHTRGCLHRPGVAWGILPAHPTNPHPRGCSHRPEGGILPAHSANPPLSLHHVPYPYCNPTHLNKSTIERKDPF